MFIIRHPSGVHRAGCECPCAAWEFPSIEATLPLFVVPQRTSGDITRDSYLALACWCPVVLHSWKKKYTGEQALLCTSVLCVHLQHASIWACMPLCLCVHMCVIVCACTWVNGEEIICNSTWQKTDVHSQL